MSMTDFMFDMNKRQLCSYINERLAGKDTNPSLLPGRMMSVIDILISYHNRKDLSTEQRKWFWEAWKISTMKGKEKNQFQYTKGLSLASILLDIPDQAKSLGDFISIDVKDYGHEENYSNENRQLKLLLKWGIVEQGDKFWGEVLIKYLQNLKGNNSEYPPIISACDGIKGNNNLIINQSKNYDLLYHINELAHQSGDENIYRECRTIFSKDILSNSRIKGTNPRDVARDAIAAAA